jgi:hypothetical protein
MKKTRKRPQKPQEVQLVYSVRIEQWEDNPESRILVDKILAGEPIVKPGLSSEQDHVLYKDQYTKAVVFNAKLFSLGYAKVAFQNALSAVKYNDKAFGISKKTLFFPARKGCILVPLLIAEITLNSAPTQQEADNLSKMIDKLADEGCFHQIGIVVPFADEDEGDEAPKPPHNSQTPEPIQEPSTDREWEKN